MSTKTNDFLWSGPYVRPAINCDLSSIVYGVLPPRFLAAVKQKVLQAYRQHRMRGVKRMD